MARQRASPRALALFPAACAAFCCPEGSRLTKPVEATTQCNGKRVDGGRCRRTPAKGFSVCHWHGAKAPQVLARGLQRKLELEARTKLVTKFSKNQAVRLSFDDAADELEQVIVETINLKDIAGEAFSRLEGELRYAHHAGEQLRAEVAFYERMLKSAGDQLIQYQKLGLDERRVRIDELKVSLILGAISRILERLELTPEQAEAARVIVPEELTALRGRG
jgi:hypothetical protein